MSKKLTDDEDKRAEKVLAENEVHIENIWSYIIEKKMRPNIAIAVLIIVLKNIIQNTAGGEKIRNELKDSIIGAIESIDINGEINRIKDAIESIGAGMKK